MTSAGTEQSLTFNYGETPHEMIREAIVRHDPEIAFNLQVPTTDDGDTWAGSPDELLTVLDALKVRGDGTRPGPRGVGERAEWTALNRDARKLRISILAALGITES